MLNGSRPAPEREREREREKLATGFETTVFIHTELPKDGTQDLDTCKRESSDALHIQRLILTW